MNKQREGNNIKRSASPTKPATLPRKLKGGEFKLTVSLNDEQKLAKKAILENKLIVLRGSAGSGKTLTAVAVALDMLLKGEIKKIVVTRPLVTTGNEDLGALPGGIAEKTLPFLIPIYDNMYTCLDKFVIDSFVADGTIEICPIAYVKGRTFVNSFVIIDEAQNCTHSQMESLLTRLGIGSTMVVCGDAVQCDLKHRKDSGFPFLKKLEGVAKIAFIDLLKNHRDPIVEEILKVYGEYRD